MKFLGLALLAVNAFSAVVASPQPFGTLAPRNNDNGNGNGNTPGKPYVRLDKDKAALVVVDHQTGLTSLVRDIDPPTFHQNVLAFADIGNFFNIPVVLTTSREEGPNGPMMPEILEMYPNTTVVKRPGQINAWDSEEFVAAVKATGRNQLIVSGIVTEVCVAFLTLSAIEAGFEVFVVTDASGTFNSLIRDASWTRMEAAGAQLVTFFAAACELARDWRTNLEGLGAFFAKHIPEYASVMASYNGAVAAAQAPPANSTSQ